MATRGTDFWPQLQRLVVRGAVFFFMAGCSVNARNAASLAEPYPTNSNFSQVFLFKPAETETQTVAFALGPLLLVEVTTSNLATQDKFGELTNSKGGLVVSRDKPTVYYSSDVVVINGKVHARQSYCWFYGESGGSEAVRAQGVRLTLSSAGFPVIWEVLSAGSSRDVLFVSESMERAASTNWGAPGPGRNYAIERDSSDAPETIVPRILQDGPVPMGPIVYVSAGSHRVCTILCRCMPSEAKVVVNSSTYMLRPVLDAANMLSSFRNGLNRSDRVKWRSWFEPGSKERGLDTRLRLPVDW